MEYRRFGRDLFVRLDKGERLHDVIRSLSDNGISTAALTSGIGRVRETEIGFLDSDGIYLAARKLLPLSNEKLGSKKAKGA